MKDFLKRVLATVVGIILFWIGAIFLLIYSMSILVSIGNTQQEKYSSAVLTMDMSKIILAEQSQETDPLMLLQSNGADIRTLGIRSAISAINSAAQDNTIRYIYLKPDGVMGGMAQIEELRTALTDFRQSGKAVISYMENPTNAGYYLASASDKIYMTSHEGGMNMFTGISSQMVFLKDLLEKLGVNVQLIRHGKFKSAGEMFINSEPSMENLVQNKELIASIWSSWAGVIAESREIHPSLLNSLLDDLDLKHPDDFLKYGLVDGLVTHEELEEALSIQYGVSDADEIHLVSICDYATEQEKKMKLLPKSKIAVVYLEGEIVDGNGYDQIAGDRYAKILADIRKDPTVEATVLRVNSPGGSVLASEKIRAQVLLLQETMPVIASFGDYAASGGYWISSSCNQIFTNATTLTGSIGVFSMIPDFSSTLNDKLHVHITSINSNEHSDMYGMMRPLTETETAYLQTSVEKVYKTFTSIVADGREMSIDKVDEIAQGRVWTGKQAVELGLADEIGTLEDAINYAKYLTVYAGKISDIQIAEYPQPLTSLQILLTQLEGGEQNIFADTPFQSVGEAFGKWNASENGKLYARMPYEIVIQ